MYTDLDYLIVKRFEVRTEAVDSIFGKTSTSLGNRNGLSRDPFPWTGNYKIMTRIYDNFNEEYIYMRKGATEDELYEEVSLRNREETEDAYREYSRHYKNIFESKFHFLEAWFLYKGDMDLYDRKREGRSKWI